MAVVAERTSAAGDRAGVLTDAGAPVPEDPDQAAVTADRATAPGEQVPEDLGPDGVAEAARRRATVAEGASPAADPAMRAVAITGAVIIGAAACPMPTCPTEVPPAATVGMMAMAAMTGAPVTIMADKSRVCV
ncbi:hypothetical protein GCM10023158_28270 [Gluconacetobacter tumulicola]